MSLLSIENLNVHYGKAQALRDVNIVIEEGEFISVIGPNGAGKTTLFNAISGLVGSTGQIFFSEEQLPVKPNEIVKRGLIHCPEGRSLFPFMSVEDNLRLGAFRRKKEDEIERDLENVYELFPRLKEREKQRTVTLSGGEQQMVAIGRALMGKPRLLLLDEPTLGLAPIVRTHISQALDEAQKRFNMTIFLAEQNSDFAFQHSQRIYLLETGEVVREGTAEEMKKDEYIREVYLGA